MNVQKMRSRAVFSVILVLGLIGSVEAQRESDNKHAGKLKVKESVSAVVKTKGSIIQDIFPSATGGYWSIGTRYLGSRMSVWGIVGKYRNAYYVQNYDSDLNLVEEKKLSLKFGGKFLDFHSIKKVGRDYYIFLTFNNELKSKKYLFYGLFDPISLEVDGDIFKMAEIKSKGKGYSYPSFEINTSKDEDFLVVFGRDSKKYERKRLFQRLKNTSTDGEKHQFKFTFWVFNDKMKAINYQKNYELEIENSSDKFYVRDYAVDENGSVYILGKNMLVDRLSSREKKKRGTKVWSEYQKSAFILERINPDGTSEQYITPEDMLYIDMSILFDQGKDIQLIGLSGEQYFNGLLCTGVSRLVLDNDMDEISTLNANFTDEVLSNVNDIQEYEKELSGRRKKKYNRRKARKEKRMTDEEKQFAELAKRAALNIKSIEYAGIDEEGNAFAVLEEQFVRVVTTTTTNSDGSVTTTTTYYYHYEDLIFCKFYEDDVEQNYFSKKFISVNYALPKSLDARAMENGDLQIVTQQQFIYADEDLNVKVGEVNALKRRNKIEGMGRYGKTARKITENGEILLAAQRGRKLAWIRARVRS